MNADASKSAKYSLILAVSLIIFIYLHKTSNFEMKSSTVVWYNPIERVNRLYKEKEWSHLLLKWYQQNKRDLPWRQTYDPYAIWVSEIMLQQTRVETVKDFYRRFLENFPDVETLATATEADVLKLWEGLGYYSRARNMQKAAKLMVTEYQGAFPSHYSELCALPGIGAYTAGAIASIAFGEAVPAIDGNVKRVSSRLFGIRENIDSPASQKIIVTNLMESLPENDAANFNQAMMELGDTICTPRAPSCEQCPLDRDCDAFEEGDQESLPVHEKKSPAKEIDISVSILTWQKNVLLFHRSERLLHGLYVFYLLEQESDPVRIREALHQEGINATFVTNAGEASHIFTHRIWRMKLYHYRLLEKPSDIWLQAHDAVLADEFAIAKLALPTAMKAAKKIALEILTKNKG